MEELKTEVTTKKGLIKLEATLDSIASSLVKAGYQPTQNSQKAFSLGGVLKSHDQTWRNGKKAVPHNLLST